MVVGVIRIQIRRQIIYSHEHMGEFVSLYLEGKFALLESAMELRIAEPD
jgi:hypothetical protein